MKIVQLSDIHVGSQFREKVFDQVIKEVNQLKPDAIVITGDLTNEGLIQQYEKCKELVSTLKTKKLSRLVVITITGTPDTLFSKNTFPLKQLTN